MSPIKATILATLATIALAGPALAQNFQGFGAPSYVTRHQHSIQQRWNNDTPLQTKAVKLRTNHAR